MQSEQSDVQMESVVDTDSELSDEELEQILEKKGKIQIFHRKGGRELDAP